MQMGLRALAAGGALMVATLQGGRREMTRFEPERDPQTGDMTDQPAFEQYLGRVNKEGMTSVKHPNVTPRIIPYVP
jgi:hypothetical protein